MRLAPGIIRQSDNVLLTRNTPNSGFTDMMFCHISLPWSGRHTRCRWQKAVIRSLTLAIASTSTQRAHPLTVDMRNTATS